MEARRSAVTPDALRAIDRVRKRNGERWTVEYVVGCIEAGKAALFEFVDDWHIAWIVVEANDGHERAMNVWILEGSPGTSKNSSGITFENRDEMVRLVDGIARSIGAKLWKLESPRKGWARVLRGFITNQHIVYERVLK